MYQYSFTQWLLIFYIYSVFGWCFESMYVSLKTRRFTNRGFLHGPILPIYGSGAVVVLFATLSVKKSPMLVYLKGALSATILEYFTGLAMETLFKVRYWDYSDQKFNYKGQICLSSSITWGFLSLAMVYGFHKPVEWFVFLLSKDVVEYVTFTVLIVLVVDATLSFKTAFELRDLLIKLEEAKREFKRLHRRLEVVEAIVSAEGAQKKEEFIEELEQLKEKQQVVRVKLKGHFSPDKLSLLRRNPSAVSKKYHAILEEYRERIHDLDVEEWKEKLKELLSRDDEE